MIRVKSDASCFFANFGFEAELWLSADKLRRNLDAAEYKHVILSLIGLKNISDNFGEHHAKLAAGKSDFGGWNPEDNAEFLAANIFRGPVDARWSQLQAGAKRARVGKEADDAMAALDRDHPRLIGVLN